MMPFFKLFAVFPASCEKHFLGLNPWYHYLSHDSADDAINKCSVKFNLLPNAGAPSDAPLVIIAVIDDLLRIAGIVAVVFVISGAIRYITSDGNPEKLGKARETVLNALIGLAVALTAIAFVSFLGNKLG